MRKLIETLLTCAVVGVAPTLALAAEAATKAALRAVPFQDVHTQLAGLRVSPRIPSPHQTQAGCFRDFRIICLLFLK